MLSYRHAVAADAPEVMAFWATAAEDSHRPPDSTEAVLRLIARDPRALMLAMDNNQVVGSIIAGWDGNAQAHRVWATAGYAPQPEWSRWVKPL
ncbi:hypothetical protein ACQHIV_29700 [Kribbella sp. GL6]|uniref:hypothetical protein n=1 Tax=Kribbella sp. GL6 TaxID=3419765 RepID=UPI003CFF22BC